MTETSEKTAARFIVSMRHKRPDDLTTGRGGTSFADIIDTTTGQTVTSFPHTIGLDTYIGLARRFAEARNNA